MWLPCYFLPVTCNHGRRSHFQSGLSRSLLGGEIAAHWHDTTWWNGGGQAGREGSEDGGGQPAGLGRAMLQYLAAFVRTGDPNTGGHGAVARTSRVGRNIIIPPNAIG